MLKKLEKKDVLDYLSSLTEKQFVELFYESVKGKRIDDTSTEYERAHWVLAEASQIHNDEGTEWEPWQVQLLASHDPEAYPEGWNDSSPICQEGNVVGILYLDGQKT